jgi:methionine synthase II (cobalamin-independent)
VADVDPALGQQILDIAQRQRVSHVHHHDQTDDLWRAVEISERIAHAPRLTQPGTAREFALTPPTIILGVLDLSTPEIETAATVAARIRRALVYRKPEDIIVAPDCGLKYLPRDAAFGKMKAMVEGARTVRTELAAQ